MGTVATFIMLASILVTTMYSIDNTRVAANNDEVRAWIRKFVSKMNKEISASRLDANRIIALLKARNANALVTYLQTNPVIGADIRGLMAQSQLIEQIMAEQSSIESDIATLESQLSQHGYGSRTMGSEETKVVKREQKDLQDAKNKYDELGKRAQEEVDKIPQYANTVQKVYTADLDATSQNINGGLK